MEEKGPGEDVPGAGAVGYVVKRYGATRTVVTAGLEPNRFVARECAVVTGNVVEKRAVVIRHGSIRRIDVVWSNWTCLADETRFVLTRRIDSIRRGAV
jgi:hypothetical protein